MQLPDQNPKPKPNPNPSPLQPTHVLLLLLLLLLPTFCTHCGLSYMRLAASPFFLLRPLFLLLYLIDNNATPSSRASRLAWHRLQSRVERFVCCTRRMRNIFKHTHTHADTHAVIE